MRKIILGLTLLAAVRGLPQGSTGSGNGDYLLTQHNACFVGEEPVNYCIEAAPDDFSVPMDDVGQRAGARSLVAKVIAEWVDALAKIPTGPSLDNLQNGKPVKLSFNFQEKPCNGKDRIDLHVLLGVDSPKVFANRYAIERLVAYDTDQTKLTGRKQCYLWVPPDMGPRKYLGLTNDIRSEDQPEKFWSLGKRFANVLRHAFGHVFLGEQHIARTFMDPHVLSELVTGPVNRKKEEIETTVASAVRPDWSDPGTGKLCGELVQTKEHNANSFLSTFDDKFLATDRLCIQSSVVGKYYYFTLEFLNAKKERIGSLLIMRAEDKIKEEDEYINRHQYLYLQGKFAFDADKDKPFPRNLSVVHLGGIRFGYNFGGYVFNGNRPLAISVSEKYPSFGPGYIFFEIFSHFANHELILHLDPQS